MLMRALHSPSKDIFLKMTVNCLPKKKKKSNYRRHVWLFEHKHIKLSDREEHRHSKKKGIEIERDKENNF